MSDLAPGKTKQDELQRKLAGIKREAEERAAEARAQTLKIPYVDVRKTPSSMDALALIPEEQARLAKVGALQIKNNAVALAAYDPTLPEVAVIKAALEKKNYKVNFFIVSEDALEEVWRMYRFSAHQMKEITGHIEISKERWDELLKKFSDFRVVQQEFAKLVYEKISTTELFELVMSGGLASRASDIHLEPEEKNGKLRYRIDGLLHEVISNVPTRSYQNVVSRIKLLSSLKLNIHSETQDGRFTMRLVDRDIEMRVSIMPAQYGETVVMRILDPRGINVSLEELGLRSDDLVMIKKELERPNGLILNTGPTGSGKTTTLYTFLRSVSNPEVKIITIEDPVEYHLPGISQTQTDPKAGYTFASGLRAILRQDPDIILVGEIRDLETAEIAMNASLTGHLVFSTLHTNDAIGAVPRFLDLGVKAPILGPALTLVIAQRLVRRLCQTCKKPAEVAPEMAGYIQTFLKRLPARVDRTHYEKPQLFQAVGCNECHGFGYKGRVGIYEFFRKTPELEELIAKGVTIIELRKVAKSQEMIFMQADGILKVLEGRTTFDEVEGVTGPIEWEKE